MPILIFDYAQLGPLPSIRSRARLGLGSLLFSTLRLGVLMFVLDFTSLGFATSVRSKG